MPSTSPRRAAALLIGVGRYRHGISPLGLAVRDARALARLLVDPDVCAFPRASVRLLADEKATRKGVARALSRWLPEEAQGADLALIYFAGHGVIEPSGPGQEGYLLPHDADPTDLARQALSMTELSQWISRISARAAVVCLDCCHAGAILPGDGATLRGDRDLTLSPSVLERLGGQGRFLIASCGRGQKSIEAEDLRHGLFTYHLIRGLRGEAARDGRVTAGSLFAHVAEAVQRDARERFGREQTPWTHATYSEDVVLATPAAEKPRSQSLSGEAADLADQLRRLRKKPDGARLGQVFSSLAHHEAEVRSRAREALHALGWDAARSLILDSARAGSDVTPYLEGLAALEASERVEALLGQLVGELRGEARLRAAHLHSRKKLALDCPRLAAAFREEKRPYEVVRALGPGLYTGAYLARALQGGHEVVLRVLRPEYALQPMIRGQFLRVSLTAVPMVHQNLVLTRHAEELADIGLCYAVRDYVHGATLREVLESGRTFSREQAVKLLRHVARGLTPLHRAGLAHNGVKPSNVFLAADGRILLGDPSLPIPPMGWDVPRLAYDLRYAAPEMFQPSGPVVASDLYSLGCVAHELFTGRPPHVSDSPWELIALHGKSHPSCSGIPDRLGKWVSRLLAPRPAGRFASLDQALEALSSAEAPHRQGEALATMGLLKELPGAAPPSVMAGDLSSDALVAPESLEDAAGVHSMVPFSAADGSPLTYSVGSPALEHAHPSPPPLPTVPGYEVREMIGRGGMGVVYRAHDPKLGRDVALKMILGGGLAGEQARARFHTEARAVARLGHPNIVNIYGLTEHEGSLVMAMELCSGGSLASRLREGPLPIDQAAHLLAQLARGLAHAHGRGMTHRDVKPGNVLFTDEGVPKLTDFGLARLHGQEGEAADGAALTMSGVPMGTPGYMPPEQARGESRWAGPAADVYSLGAVLYACLTGRPPFQGTSPLEVIRQAVDQDPKAPSSVRPEVPGWMDELCLLAMARDPSKRLSAQDFAESLESGKLVVSDGPHSLSLARRRSTPPAQVRRRWWWPF
jgi:serine/threonine protein kinase/uncharacterized caspase-like protein